MPLDPKTILAVENFIESYENDLIANADTHESAFLLMKKGAIIQKHLEPLRTIRKRLEVRRFKIETAQESERETAYRPNAKPMREMAETVLRDVPATRDDDALLTTEIWRRFYGVGDKVPLSLIPNLPREDSVKRIRAKIQNDEWRFLPTKEKTVHARKINLQRWREKMRREL